MRRHFPLLASLLLASFVTVGAGRAAPLIAGCRNGEVDPTSAFLPVGGGPLTLTKFYCLKEHSGGSLSSPPEPSPDGNSVFVFAAGKGLWVTGVDAERAESIPGYFDGRLSGVHYPGVVPFAWSGNSRSVLGVRQETVKPSGFALGPLRPFLFSIDGTMQPLPDLLSATGPLDELYWAGHAGMAIAAFGTRGNYYRPTHEDAQPTIAFVDGRIGQVIQSAGINDIPGLAKKNPIISAVAAAVDAGGRIHALIAFFPDRWVSWVQGQNPQIVPLETKVSNIPFVLSPDGRSVLIMKNLSAFGRICERNPNCPPPTPSTGAIAELRDVASGKLIWSIDGTAKYFHRSDIPAVSLDGRYALISMPPGDQRSTIALVSMDTGRVIQEIPHPWSGQRAVGFSRDSRVAWISSGPRLAIYEIRP